MSDYLNKKSKRTQNKNGFNIKISKQINEENQDTVNTDQVTLKIGKYWDSKNLLEPKNTIGELSFIEYEGKNYTLSQVGDGLLIMESETLNIVKEIKQNEETIIAFTVNHVNNDIICSMNNSLVRVFNLENPEKCAKVWKLDKEQAKLIKIDPTGRFIAMISTRHSIMVYDSQNFKLLNIFKEHSNFIYDLAFSPEKDKFLIYSCSEDGTVRISDIILNKCIGVLDNHSNGVRKMTLTNDGRSLISTTLDNNIYIWRLSDHTSAKNNLLKVIKYDRIISSIYYFTRSHSLKELTPTLLIGSEDGFLCELNLKTGLTEAEKFFGNQPITQIHYSTKEHTINLLTGDQTITQLKNNLVNDNITCSEVIKMYPGYCQELLDLKIMPVSDSNFSTASFFFSSNDSSLKFYNSAQASINPMSVYDGHTDFIMNIDVKDNYVSTSSKDMTVRIWKYSYDDSIFNCQCIAVLKGHSETVNSSCLITKKGVKRVVTCSKDCTVKIWDLSAAIPDNDVVTDTVTTINQSIHSEIAHDEEVNLVRVSTNERLIASGSFDKTIKIWSTELKLQGTLSGHKRSITDFSFSKFAKLIVSASTDKSVKIWNLNDFSCINTFEGHLSSVLKVQWIYYGTHLLTTGADGLVKFWNIKTSECVNTIDAHEGKIWALDSVDSAPVDNPNPIKSKLFFITGGTDSKISLWTDSTTEREIKDLLNAEDKIMKKERLKFLNDNKNYYEAMNLSLQLNHKSEFIQILKNYVSNILFDRNENGDQISMIINNRKVLQDDDENKNKNESKFIHRFDKMMKDCDLRNVINENLEKILEIVRDYNVSSTNFTLVHILLKLILITTNFQNFINSKKKNLGLKNKKMKLKERINIDTIENFLIIKTYSEKHLERIKRQMIKSYLVDYVLEKMKII